MQKKDIPTICVKAFVVRDIDSQTEYTGKIRFQSLENTLMKQPFESISIPIKVTDIWLTNMTPSVHKYVIRCQLEDDFKHPYENLIQHLLKKLSNMYNVFRTFKTKKEMIEYSRDLGIIIEENPAGKDVRLLQRALTWPRNYLNEE